MVKLERYYISHITEETVCEYCGCPLETGDVAYMAPSERVYCSGGCAHSVEDRQPERPEPAKQQSLGF